MARKIGEIELDLNKVKLWGWEPVKNALVVAAMTEGIKLKSTFPSVDVRGVRDRGYIILDGHHRALASYIMGEPLRVDFFGEGELKDSSVLIGDIILKDKVDGYFSHLRDALGHLPRDVAERFCYENNLDVCKYLAQ